MAGFDNNLSGVLFQTQDKRTEKSPDNYGNCEIDGKKYKISGWIKQNSRGNFISLRFTADGDAQNDRPAPKPQSGDFFGSGQRQAPAPRQDDTQRRSGTKSAAEIAYEQSQGNNRPAPNLSDMDDDIPF